MEDGSKNIPQKENSSELDEFTLDVDESEDEDDFSLSLDDETEESEENAAESSETEKSENHQENRPSVEEFYSKIVERYSSSRTQNFPVFLLQGGIPAETLYSILALPLFAKPTDDDIQRIEYWASEWTREAAKYERIDLEKYNDIKDCANHISYHFSNPKKNIELTESLRSVAWSHLATLIAEKCEDGTVSLKEQVSIKKSAKSLGLYKDADSESVRKRIVDEINRHEATVETLESEFKAFCDDFFAQKAENKVDFEENRTLLAKRYKKLKQFSDFVAGKESDFSESELPAVLNSLGITLLNPSVFFASDYFASYCQTHDISKLSEAEFAELKSTATGKYYRLSDSAWSEFVLQTGIAVGQNSEDEISREKIVEEVSQEYQTQIAQANAQLEKEKNRAEKAAERAKNAKRNGILRAFFIIVLILAAIFGIFAALKKLNPVQYASVVDSVTTLVAPSEEQLEQARLAKEKARLMFEAEQAHSYTVGAGADFKTIAEAIEKVNDGDTLILKAGVHSANTVISKQVRITGGEAAVAAINSGYFSSKDLPILILEKNNSLRISAAAEISGVLISQNSRISFDSFQKYEKSAKMPPNQSFATTDPMSKDFRTTARISANAVFKSVIFAESAQNQATVTAGNVSFENCSFLNAPANAIYALAFSNVRVENCNFCGADTAFLTADDAQIDAENANISKVWYGFLTNGKSFVKSAQSSIIDFRQAAFKFAGSSGGNIAGGIAKTSITKGNRTAIWASDFASPKADSLKIENCVLGILSEGNSAPQISNCTIDASGAGDAKNAAVFTDSSKGVMENCTVLGFANAVRVQKSASPEIKGAKISAEGGFFGVVFSNDSGGSFGGEISGFQRGIYVEGKAVPNLLDASVHNCEKAGITYIGESGGTAENCAVFDCPATGVSINDKTFPILTAVKVRGTRTGFLSSEKNSAKLINCESIANENGFSVFWDGSNSPENEISGGSFSENSGIGIIVNCSAKIAVSDTKVLKNAFGIAIGQNSEVSLNNVSILESEVLGLGVQGSASVFAGGCKIEKNKGFGCTASGSANISAKNCSFSKNGESGFSAGEKSSAVLEDCSIVKNAQSGAESSGKSRVSFLRCKIKSNKGENLSLGSEIQAEITDLKTSLWTRFKMWLDE